MPPRPRARRQDSAAVPGTPAGGELPRCGAERRTSTFAAAVAAPWPRGCSSMVEPQLPKLVTGVRFPSPAPGGLRDKTPEPWEMIAWRKSAGRTAVHAPTEPSYRSEPPPLEPPRGPNSGVARGRGDLVGDHQRAGSPGVRGAEGCPLGWGPRQHRLPLGPHGRIRPRPAHRRGRTVGPVSHVERSESVSGQRAFDEVQGSVRAVRGRAGPPRAGRPPALRAAASARRQLMAARTPVLLDHDFREPLLRDVATWLLESPPTGPCTSRRTTSTRSRTTTSSTSCSRSTDLEGARPSPSRTHCPN
jgi:hypothetical protein